MDIHCEEQQQNKAKRLPLHLLASKMGGGDPPSQGQHLARAAQYIVTATSLKVIIIYQCLIITVYKIFIC